LSYDLVIRLEKGFEPPFELPVIEPDPDRSEEEERAWREARLAETKNAAQRAFRRNLSSRAMRFVVGVLRHAGAVWEATRPAKNGAREAWGPNGEVADYKLRSNDRWLLSPEECRVLGLRLGEWLRSGVHRIELEGQSYDLGPEVKSKHDREARAMLEDLAAFFVLAAQHQGLEVH
jgi:hypothetical protein